MYKVSVIIPVYNAGNRFARSIDSILSQTLKEIEVILILDKPTDGTDKMAYAYATKDSRITLVENETNQHIGYSRNKGILMARGEYIAFSDHDDYKSETMYEILYNEAKTKDSDIVFSEAATTGEETSIVHFPNPFPENDIRQFLLKDLIAGGLSDDFTPYVATIHPQIFKREFIINHTLNFVDTRQKNPEDRIFLLQALFFSEKIAIVREAFYYHERHSQSAGHTHDYVNFNKRYNGKIEIYDFLIKNGIYHTYEKLLSQSIVKEFSNLIINEFIEYKNISNSIRHIRILKNSPIFRNAFRDESPTLKNYKFGGRALRILISFLIR